MGTLDALQYSIGAGGVSAFARSSRAFNPNFGLVGTKSTLSTSVKSQNLGFNTKIITDEYVHYGTFRTAYRSADGRFIAGTARKVDLGERFNLSRATPWSPVNTSVPTWVRWSAIVGGGSVLANQILNHDK